MSLYIQDADLEQDQIILIYSVNFKSIWLVSSSLESLLVRVCSLCAVVIPTALLKKPQILLQT